jgi:hypothetical protein
VTIGIATATWRRHSDSRGISRGPRRCDDGGQTRVLSPRLGIDDIRTSRKSVSESQVRIPPESLAVQPIKDSFGDVGPSGFKHHVVSHAGKELCLSSVGACSRTDLVVGDGAVGFTAEDQERCVTRSGLESTNNPPARALSACKRSAQASTTGSGV